MSKTPKVLADKTAWITGAASGIGEAAAIALARAGATVVLTGRREKALAALAARVADDGGNALVAAGDVTDVEAMEAVVAMLAARGSIDIFVNNAGVNIPDRAWTKLTMHSADLLLDVNLRAGVQLSRAVLPVMQAHGGGLLIHLASWAAHFIGPGAGPVYTVAKSGIVAMSHTINIEFGRHGIRSCVLSPGDTLTPMIDKRPVPTSEEARARALKPGDVAALILHVATLPRHVCVNEIIVSPTSLQ